MKQILASLFLLSSLTTAASTFGSAAYAAASEKFYENSASMPILNLVHNAKSSVDIEIYEMDDPLFLTEVKAAVDRGVRVRVVKEDRPVGKTCRVFIPKDSNDDDSCQTQKDLVSYINASGGKYIAFDTATLCGIQGSHCFEHGKVVIVDGTQALISTGNFNSSNLCNKAEHPDACNRDYSVVSTDADVVSTLSTIFEGDLTATSFDVNAILQKSTSHKLTASPLSLQPLVDFIGMAKTKLQIQNQYLKDPNMNKAIMDAAARGVDVEIMVASACSFGKPSAGAVHQWTANYTAFDKAGVKTRIFTRNIKVNGAAGYLHAKAIVVDGSAAWVGSVNGSTTSLTNNREYGIFLTQPTEVKKLQAFMSQDFADPAGETWEDSASCKHDPRPSPQSANHVPSEDEL